MTPDPILLSRITQTPGQCGGQPCIRGLRIRVSDILDMLACQVSADEILRDFPDLESNDILACLLFAAHCTALPQVAALRSSEKFLSFLETRSSETGDIPFSRVCEKRDL